MKNFAALTRMRIQLTVRNKMFIFFTLVMPFGFYFLFTAFFAKGDVDKIRFFLGPILALTVMGSFWGLSAALVTFREQGILRQFHIAPVTPGDMLASSIVATYILTLPTIAGELLLTRVVYHVHDLGNLFSIFVMVTLGSISFASMGLVVASITNTMQETQVLNQLLWLPLIFISGATIPLASLPSVAQNLAAFLPASYLVDGIQKGALRSVAVWKLPVEIFSLAFWTILTFFVASQLFRWEPEAKIPRNAKLWALGTIIPFLLLGVWEFKSGNLHADAQAAYHFFDEDTPPQPPPLPNPLLYRPSQDNDHSPPHQP